MIHRIEIAAKGKDSRAETLKKRLREEGIRADGIWVTDIYTIEKILRHDQLEKIGEALANPIVQTFQIRPPLAPKHFDWALEIGFLPGVTDNVAHTVKEIIADLLKTKFKPEEGVYTSAVYFFEGKLKH